MALPKGAFPHGLSKPLQDSELKRLVPVSGIPDYNWRHDNLRQLNGALPPDHVYCFDCWHRSPGCNRRAIAFLASQVGFIAKIASGRSY